MWTECSFSFSFPFFLFFFFFISLVHSSFLLAQVELYPDSGPSLIPLVDCDNEYPDVILSLGKAPNDPGNITVRTSTHVELAVVIVAFFFSITKKCALALQSRS